MITEVLHDERIFTLLIAVCLPMAGCNSGSCNIAAKISDMNRLTQQVIVESAYYSCIRAARYSLSGTDIKTHVACTQTREKLIIMKILKSAQKPNTYKIRSKYTSEKSPKFAQIYINAALKYVF